MGEKGENILMIFVRYQGLIDLLTKLDSDPIILIKYMQLSFILARVLRTYVIYAWFL